MYSKKPVLLSPPAKHHHPGQQEDHVEVDGRERLFLVDDPEDHDQQAAEQRDERPVNPLGRDQPVGDEEDAAGEEDVHGQAVSNAQRARRQVGWKVISAVGSARSRAERGSVLPHPPGPSLAATTSDVCPRLTLVNCRVRMTATGYTRLRRQFDAPSASESANRRIT